jgi:hypothetical protein
VALRASRNDITYPSVLWVLQTNEELTLHLAGLVRVTTIAYRETKFIRLASLPRLPEPKLNQISRPRHTLALGKSGSQYEAPEQIFALRRPSLFVAAAPDGGTAVTQAAAD